MCNCLGRIICLLVIYLQCLRRVCEETLSASGALGTGLGASSLLPTRHPHKLCEGKHTLLGTWTFLSLSYLQWPLHRINPGDAGRNAIEDVKLALCVDSKRKRVGEGSGLVVINAGGVALRDWTGKLAEKKQVVRHPNAGVVDEQRNHAGNISPQVPCVTLSLKPALIQEMLKEL